MGIIRETGDGVRNYFEKIPESHKIMTFGYKVYMILICLLALLLSLLGLSGVRTIVTIISLVTSVAPVSLSLLRI